MNINPFEILKNAEKIQEQMAQMQEKLGEIQVTGSAGGGMAEITMNGRMELVSVKIAPEAVDPEEVALLQDLIMAAFTDASEKIKDVLKTEMGGLAGQIPGGMPGMGF